MGRAPCCSREGLNRGTWTAMEDKTMMDYIEAHGEGQWTNLAKKAGLKRCGKSCRLRWLNYLRPNIKRGNITPDEEELIMKLHKLLGNRWSLIAGRLPGRTDNEIKNYWNTNLGKKLQNNPTNSSQNRHQKQHLQLHSSANTEKNPTPSFDQQNIQQPSSENVVRSEPYLSRPKASKSSIIQETAFMLTDEIAEKHQEGPLVMENNETMLSVVGGEQSQNPPELIADFEMDENALADFLNCDLLKLCDFDHYNDGEEHKSFPSGTLVISDTENDQVQQESSDFHQPMSPLLASEEMAWI